MTKQKKNDITRALADRLKALGLEHPVWARLAAEVAKPVRRRREVNVISLERYSKPKDTVVVPGVVMGAGELTKPVTVAALKFTGQAEEKIRKAGGKTMSIEQLIEEKPKGSGVRIIG